MLGCVARRYPIPKMLEVARLVLGKGQSICDADCESRHEFFSPTLDAIVELCTAFPLLAGNVIDLFLKVCFKNLELTHQIPFDFCAYY